MAAALREPLVHFALGAALIFGVERARRRDEGPRPIVVSDAFVRGLGERQRLLLGRPPTAAEEAELVRAWVREEVLYREGRAMRLDEGDGIVRRRVVQKMEFVIEAGVAVSAPTEEMLARWLAEHAEAWREPARVAFAQVLFARDRRGARALDDARAALARVRATTDTAACVALGDAFVAGHVFALRSERDVAAVFGDAMARAVMAMPAGAWSEPVESPYGAHLVRVTGREPGRLPALAEVREAVLRDWTSHAREEAAREAIARRAAAYRVVRVRDEGLGR